MRQVLHIWSPVASYHSLHFFKNKMRLDRSGLSPTSHPLRWLRCDRKTLNYMQKEKKRQAHSNIYDRGRSWGQVGFSLWCKMQNAGDAPTCWSWRRWWGWARWCREHHRWRTETRPACLQPSLAQCPRILRTRVNFPCNSSSILLSLCFQYPMSI